MNQNIITYLNENKEKYSQDALIAELHKAGYSEGDIAEGVAQVFGGTVPAIAPAKTSFWNFKDKKVYTSAGQKWADFLFGFFVSGLLLWVVWNFFLTFFLFPSMGSAGVEIFDFGRGFIIIIEILFAVYLFSRRHFMFFGLSVFMLFSLPALAVFFN